MLLVWQQKMKAKTNWKSLPTSRLIRDSYFFMTFDVNVSAKSILTSIWDGPRRVWQVSTVDNRGEKRAFKAHFYKDDQQDLIYHEHVGNWDIENNRSAYKSHILSTYPNTTTKWRQQTKMCDYRNCNSTLDVRSQYTFLIAVSFPTTRSPQIFNF